MRTLHVLPELKEGGLERGVVEKAVWLREHGIYAVVVSAGGIWLDRLEKAGVRHHTLPVHLKNPVSIINCAFKLREILEKEKIDLVSAHSRAPAWAAHLATMNGDGHRPQLVTVAQGFYEANWYSGVMSRGDRIIAVSSSIKDHMVNRIGADPEKIRVIPRGYSSGEFNNATPSNGESIRKKWGIPNGAVLVAGVGRISHTKGWEDLIDAVGMMNGEDVWCVIAGSMNERRKRYNSRLMERAMSNGNGSRVRLIDHQEDLAGVYAATDIVAAPSRLPEPFGRVIIESLMSGRPVITTEGCGAAEFLGDDFRRYLVPVNSPHAIAEKVREIMSDRDGNSRVIENLQRAIRSKLTLDRQMESTLAVYEECCEGQES